MSKSNHEALIIEYFMEGWNKGNLAIFDKIIAPDYINHSPGIANPPLGPEGLKPIVTAMRIAFPDLTYAIENMVISDDQVAVYTTVTGKHQGDFFGIAPTGKNIDIKQMQIERIKNNQIVEHWRLTDDLALMKQVGEI